MKIPLLGENGLFPTNFRIKGARQIKPTIHQEASKLWNAFHNSPFVRGNDPGRLLRTLVEEKDWKSGRILEIGADDKVAIPEIPGFEHFIITLDPGEVIRCREKAPFATVIEADAATLPFHPIGPESCNMIVWQGAMLHYVKLFADELDLPLSRYEKIYGREKVGTYRFLQAIHRTITPGGLFVELYPFFDIVEVPTLFAYLGLSMKSIDFIAKDRAHVSESEKHYLMLRTMGLPSIASLLGGEAEMSPIEEYKRSPFSAMVVEK